jgi:hypothetical protein
MVWLSRLTMVSVRQPAGATTEEAEAEEATVFAALEGEADLLGAGVLDAIFEGEDEGECDGTASAAPAVEVVPEAAGEVRTLELAAAPRSDAVSDDEPFPDCARATNTPASNARATKASAPAMRTRLPPRRAEDRGPADGCPDEGCADVSPDRWRAFRSLIHSPGGSPTAWNC